MYRHYCNSLCRYEYEKGSETGAKAFESSLYPRVYLGNHLHKEQIPAVLTLRKWCGDGSQTKALPIKATLSTVCSQEHCFPVMTQSLNLHDSMSADLSVLREQS